MYAFGTALGDPARPKGIRRNVQRDLYSPGALRWVCRSNGRSPFPPFHSRDPSEFCEDFTRYLIFSRIFFSLHENCKRGGYEWAKRTGDQATESREDFRPSRGSRGLNVRFNVLFLMGWKLRVAIVWAGSV